MDQELKTVKISEIKFDSNNPNKMTAEQLESLRYSIKKFGQLKPPIIDQTMTVCDGEHQIRAYMAEGIKEIRIIQVHCTPAQRRLIRQTMNKLSGKHDEAIDYEELKALLDDGGLEELSKLLAEDMSDIYHLLEQKHEPLNVEEDDFNPEQALKQPRYQIQQGEVWHLGNHRLMCGDSTNEEHVKKLMNEQKADMVFTDPPYGVDYSVKNEFLNKLDNGKRIEKNIINDNTKDLPELLSKTCNIIKKHVKETNSVYITFCGKELRCLLNELEHTGFKLHQILVWAKNNHVLGRLDYASKNELIIYGWYGKHKYYGKFHTSIWEVNKPTKSDLHPTMKPIELCNIAIKNSSLKEMIILDLFGGSGSTLIACEQTQRQCYMMEIDPTYCSVIIERWEQLTGNKAQKNNGKQT